MPETNKPAVDPKTAQQPAAQTATKEVPAEKLKVGKEFVWGGTTLKEGTPFDPAEKNMPEAAVRINKKGGLLVKA